MSSVGGFNLLDRPFPGTQWTLCVDPEIFRVGRPTHLESGFLTVYVVVLNLGRYDEQTKGLDLSSDGPSVRPSVTVRFVR